MCYLSINACIYLNRASRLCKVREMLEISTTYSTLGQSHVEGIETIHSRFQLLVTGMKKKPYDLLEHRKTDFDTDFEEFKRQSVDIKVTHRSPVYSTYNEVCINIDVLISGVN